MFKDYYELLEISQNASEDKIKNAFREQAIKWHPDRNQGTDTTSRMQEINEAYLILKDKEARTRYDIEYNKFKQFKEQKDEKENLNKKSDRREGKRQGQYSERKHTYDDYKVEDDILAKWMENAKRQAVALAIQTIHDLKGVTKAAATGFISGIIQLVIWVVAINILIFITRACNI